MDGDWDDPQRRTDEHHHRGLSGSREVREIFGVPGMVKTGAIKAVLVYRVGHERRGSPAADIPDGGFNRMEDRWRVARVGARRSSMNCPTDWGDRNGVVENGQRLIRSIDRSNRCRPSETPSQRSQAIGIVDEVKRGYAVTTVEPGLKRDLAADSSRLAHRDGERKLHWLRP